MQDQQVIPDQSQLLSSLPPEPKAASPTSIPESGGDAVEYAKNAVTTCLLQTINNPSARAQGIASIRADYIKAKFGVDIS